MLRIKCWDSDVGRDDLIGTCEISLLEVFEMGHVDKEYSLTYKTKKQEKHAGDIKLSFNFWGPPTIKFPQRKVPGAQFKSYGDKRRRGAGYTPAALNASAMLDLAGGAEKMKKYMSMPGALEAPGILKVRVIEAQNVKGKDSRLNCYVYMRLGSKKAHHRPHKRTKTVKCKQSSLANPKWGEDTELVVEDMESLVEDDDVVLTVDIYDDNVMLDTLLGSCDIKLKNLFLNHSGVERVEMYSFVPASAGQVKLGITFWKMSRGAALFTLVEGKNLKAPGMFTSGKGMDPYAYVECGKAKARGRTISNGGKDPVFGEEELLVYCDDDSWKKQGVITVFDDDIGRDAIIGKTEFDLLKVMTPEDKMDSDKEGGVVTGALVKGKKKVDTGGELKYGMRFLPAGRLTVKAVSGRSLRNPDARGKPDPYLVLSLEDSQMEEGVQTKKTPSHNNGGCDPQWNFDVEFEILDQYELTIKCFDKDFMSKDDLIGSGTVSLLKLFSEAAANFRDGSGSQDVWVPLSFMAGSKKGSVPAGDVHIIL
jgi:Ca2+-dependent lipid-binding protein